MGELGFVGPERAGVFTEDMKSLELKVAVTKNVPYVSSDKANAVIRRSGPPRSQEERSVRGYLFVDMLQTPVQNASKFVTPLFVIPYYLPQMTLFVHQTRDSVETAVIEFRFHNPSLLMQKSA